jgi:general secretion pathway protein J
MMPSVRARGLTLIELLIAVAVFAVLSALAYGGLNNVLLTSSRTQAEADKLMVLQLAMRYLQRDVDQIVDRPIRDQYGDPQPALISTEHSEEEPLISFTRAGWTNPAGQLRSTLQRVAYDYDEEEEEFVRIAWTTLDGATEETALRTTLLESVTGVEFRFMDQDEQWQTDWPPLQQQAQPGQNAQNLPKALEMVITTETWGEIRRILLLPS